MEDDGIFRLILIDFFFGWQSFEDVTTLFIISRRGRDQLAHVQVKLVTGSVKKVKVPPPDHLGNDFYCDLTRRRQLKNPLDICRVQKGTKCCFLRRD